MDEMNTPSTLPEDRAPTDQGSEENESKSSHHGHHHHHHHHGHSKHRHRHGHGRRHRSKHRSSRNQKAFSRFAEFLKRNRSTLVNIVACSVSVVLLVLLALQLEQNVETPQEDDIVVGVTQSSIKIESTIYVDDISLVHSAVNA